MSFIDSCKELISLESTAESGNHLVVDYISKKTKELGFKVEVQTSPRNSKKANVLIRTQNFNGKEELLLHSPLETAVPGSHFQWSKTSENPFHLSIHGDELYGLGVSTKLDLLCKLEACKEFVGKNLKVPFVIAGTYGSYTGMDGAIQLVRRKKILTKKAIICAPTNNHLCNAGLGYAIFDIIFPFSEGETKYQEDHDLMENASTQSKMFYSRSKSENAINKIFEYAEQLPSGVVLMDVDGGLGEHILPETSVLEIDMVGSIKDTVLDKMSLAYKRLMKVNEKFESYSQEGFSGSSKIDLHKIKKFEDHVVLTGCCKLLPLVSQEVYEEWMQEIRQACEELGLKFRIREHKKSFEVGEGSHFLSQSKESLKSVGLNNKLSKLSLYTEASVFSRLGVECLAFGPAKEEDHLSEANEVVRLTDLNKAIDFYKNLIEKVCL